MERDTVCFIDVVAKNCTRHRRNVLGLEIVAAERRHDHEAAARRSALLLVSNVGGSPGRTLVLGACLTSTTRAWKSAAKASPSTSSNAQEGSNGS